MEKPNKLNSEKLEDIRQQLQKIKTAIAKANSISLNGASVDLAELQNSVQFVCNQINSLPGVISADDLDPLIKTILNDFNALSETLTNQHKDLTANGR